MIYVLFSQGQTFSCKSSVDTTINGVDIMAQSKGRNVKKSSTSVNTRPGQVDTKWNQVDTRWLSQKACFAVWDSRSTRDHLRSTLETSPRELFCQSGTVCRHTSWAGRHTPEMFSLKTPPGHVAP
ncbi:hypothetical protein Taro_016401 [Colocasia esculenta]|uniref:Uncharacterized protein n=1 Tax=Colocasia esculenta TaxID=4460 RepID=A0A843UK88_COLES|nr:hypothetical protein [Colocasia esculenta]